MAEFHPRDSQLSEKIEAAHQTLEKILLETSKKIVGQRTLRERLLMALICEGHILLEGVPGLAKTLSIKTLAESLDADFKRIQFTPDLLPSDLIGSEIYRPQDGRFEVRKGPVFANFILADEINRAPAKVQSALLETMQEKQVTIGEQTLKIPDPFFVMATQNPLEQEGTYPLPEAQIDRFMMKIKVSYPTPDEEKEMLGLVTKTSLPENEKKSITTLAEIKEISKIAQSIYIDDRIKQYIIDLVNASRTPEKYGLKNLSSLIEYGASPRASIALYSTARASALFEKEHFVVPQNVKDVALDVLRHRIMPTYEAEAQGIGSEEIVKMLLEGVQVP